MLKKILPAFVFIFLLAACGGTSQPSTEITIELTDFTYSPSSITIPAGQPVVLTIHNAGLVEHDFVIDKIFVSSVVAEGDAAEHEMPDMAAESYDLHISTPVGETSTLKFTAMEPGTYQFFCTVEGHLEAGMIGELIVVPQE